MSEETQIDPSDLVHVFQSFTGNADEMDGRQFAKLCKDTKLVGGGFNTTDVDLIFAKVKDRAARKITFEQFDEALDHIGAKKGKSGEQIAEILIRAGGPKWSGTKAEATRFHDDKSAYTGVHAQGGPSTVDKGRDLSDLADRSEATVRGTKKSPTQVSKDKTPKPSPSKKSLQKSEGTPTEGLEEEKLQKDVSFKHLSQEDTEAGKIQQSDEEAFDQQESIPTFASPAKENSVDMLSEHSDQEAVELSPKDKSIHEESEKKSAE